MTEHRVLVIHNRYRVAGGEERAAELHVRALERRESRTTCSSATPPP